ncbi:MAG: aminopeptidase P family N-terminal domain-containing protein, partial [Proteobacteria bacterium]|nr:aminopeptidase P family N-terminal domain-containing protein [Pseudomonadota bacterium]
MTEKKAQSSREKLGKLRVAMTAAGVDGYIVPHTDEFQCEYTPESANRLEWLTGFTGSAGDAVILKNKAIAFTDSRYKDQIGRQIDPACFETVIIDKNVHMHTVIVENAAVGARIGFDPMLVTPDAMKGLLQACRAKRIKLVPVPENLIDSLWDGRPAAPASQVFLFPDSIAGRRAEDNRKMVSGEIRKKGAKAVIINKPDSVAWLLNIRGDDVKHTPLALSYVIAHENGKVDWFIEPSRVPGGICAHLGSEVTVRAPQELEKAVTKLGQDAAREEKPVLLDSDRASVWFKYILEGQHAEVMESEDPIVCPRARKSEQEMAGIIEGHIRDGVALAKFTRWLDETAPKGMLTEMSVADRLESFRREDPALKDLSFPTISGWNDNGAVIHYNVKDNPEKNKKIEGQGILLVDSGGQYLDVDKKVAATTDVTITRAVGQPRPDQVRAATFVLQGFIRLATARFSQGTRGRDLYYLATEAMEKNGLICPHGIGHGVGCFLGVHEDASGLTPNEKRSKMPLMPGMLVSNEPGVYFSESWGCRLERLQRVVKDGFAEDGKTEMYRFEVVTLTPFDKKLIDPNLFREDELQWLNNYHKNVYRTLAPRLD